MYVIIIIKKIDAKINFSYETTKKNNIFCILVLVFKKLFTIFYCVEYTLAQKNTNKFVFLLAYSYICTKTDAMNRKGFLYRVYDLYADGFRSMTVGRTLWAIILIKLFVIFVILKLFFFPDFLSTHAEKDGEADFVATEMTKRINNQ